MKWLILAVGIKQPAWVNDAFTDYASRLPPDQAISLKEIKAEPRTSGKPAITLKALEADRIKACLEKEQARAAGITTIALDEHGETLTTQAFAAFTQKLKDQGTDIAFIIGGPDGLDTDLLRSCAHRIRLSAMTLPHGLARVLLAEQLYRAWSLQANHPYHRA